MTLLNLTLKACRMEKKETKTKQALWGASPLDSELPQRLNICKTNL